MIKFQALLSAMERENVTPDIDFYNMLIKKRSMRFDYILAHVSTILFFLHYIVNMYVKVYLLQKYKKILVHVVFRKYF